MEKHHLSAHTVARLMEKTGVYRMENADRTDGRFQPGQSGNPAGRPRGALNRSTVMLAQRMRDKADDLAAAIMDEAIVNRSTAAMRLATSIIDRADTATRLADIRVSDLIDTDTITNCARSITAALMAGEVDPREAGATLAALGRAAELISPPKKGRGRK